MTTSANSARWLWLPLLVAAISLAMATVDLLGAVIAFARTDRPTFVDLALPGLILLLSTFTLRLGIPLLRSREKGPKWMCWLALLLGAAAAALFGAELAYAVMQEGIAVLLDFPIVIVVVLGLSCSAVAFLGIRSQPA